MRKGQVKSDGKIGKPEGWCFVNWTYLRERLVEDGSDMMLTIGLSFRNPRTHDKVFKNKSAIRWFDEHGSKYTFEAEYMGDGYLHVTALSGDDMF